MIVLLQIIFLIIIPMNYLNDIPKKESQYFFTILQKSSWTLVCFSSFTGIKAKENLFNNAVRCKINQTNTISLCNILYHNIFQILLELSYLLVMIHGRYISLDECDNLKSLHMLHDEVLAN